MATRFPILTFHAFDDTPSVISFSPRLFQRGIARLHEGGYRTLNLMEVADYVRRGAPFPDRSFVMTFDDGYASVYGGAFPVLQHYGMSATVFLTVGEKPATSPHASLPSLNGRSMLNWQQIRKMHRGGIAFGAHTLTHPDLTRLSPERLAVEVRDSQSIIEDALGAPVTCFAYPYGRYDRRSRDVVQRHYACACSDRLGMIHGGSDLYALKRVDAYYLRTERLFDLMLTGLFPWYIRARYIPRWIRRAVQLRFGG